MFSRPVTIAYSQRGQIIHRSFAEVEELQSFLDKTKNNYKWLSRYTTSSKVDALNKWIIDNIDDFQEMIKTGGNPDDFEHGLEVRAEQIFGHGGLPMSDTKRMDYLNYILNEFDQDTAIGALIYYTNRMDSADNSAYFYGSVLAANNENIDRVDIVKIAHDLKSAKEQ